MSVKLWFALAAQTVPSACTSRKLEAAKPLDLRVRPLSRFETNSREDSMAARSLRSIATYFITPSLCSNLADWCPVAIIGLGLGSVSFSSVATPCFGQGQCHRPDSRLLPVDQQHGSQTFPHQPVVHLMAQLDSD
jgi:hypothetical protein